jgi:opacity protein-like surface antigen
MKRASLVMLFAGLMLLVAAHAQAQMLQWEDRVFINVNGAFQSHPSKEVSTSSEFTLYDEKASVKTQQTIDGQGGMFDVSGGFRLFGNFGVGVGYNQLSSKSEGIIAASVPHPILYDSPRNAGATVPDLMHKEQAVHVFGLFMIPLSEKFDMAVFGGPTFFTVEQDTLSNPQVAEVGPPYTTVNLTNVKKITTSKNQTGFNVGLDATYKITRNFGLGGFFRYSAAKVDMTPEGGTALEVEAGGMQFGGGVRIRF